MDTHSIHQIAPSALPIPKLAFTIKEAEYSLGVSKRTLNRLIADGQVKSVLVRGCRLIPTTELQRLCGVDREAEIGADSKHLEITPPIQKAEMERLCGAERT